MNNRKQKKGYTYRDLPFRIFFIENNDGNFGYI